MFEEVFLLKMSDYPSNEIVDIICIVDEAGNNYSAAARLYSVRFPDRRHPNRKVMKRFSDLAKHRGTLKRTQTKTGPNEAVAISVMLNLQIFTRIIERQHGISRWTIEFLELLSFIPITLT